MRREEIDNSQLTAWREVIVDDRSLPITVWLSLPGAGGLHRHRLRFDLPSWDFLCQPGIRAWMQEQALDGIASRSIASHCH